MKIITQPIQIERPSDYRPRLSISKTTEFRLREKGLLPPVVQIGKRAVGLPKHEVDILVAAKIAEKSNDEILGIIKRLVAARVFDVEAMMEAVGA